MRSTIGCAHYVMQLAMECQLKGHNYEQRLMMSDLLWSESAQGLKTTTRAEAQICKTLYGHTASNHKEFVCVKGQQGMICLCKRSTR